MKIKFSLLLLLLIAAVLAPSAAVAQGGRCFTQTGECIGGRFLQFWNGNGGLPVFGFPLAEQRRELGTEGEFVTQWFERERFELHPENRAPYDVLLGRLGDELLKRQGRDWTTFPKGQPKAGCQFFDATGHTVCEPFLSYWRGHGLEFDGRAGRSFVESLALIGLPLSEPAMETNSSGDSVSTQWFERARLEYHPGEPDPYKVLLGRLGAEAGAVGDACAGIPASVNATIAPTCFRAGTPVALRATGFRANEQVGYTVKPPEGANIPAFLLNGSQAADSRGVVELKNSFPEGTPPGLYRVTFHGTTSGNQGTIFFKVIG